MRNRLFPAFAMTILLGGAAQAAGPLQNIAPPMDGTTKSYQFGNITLAVTMPTPQSPTPYTITISSPGAKSARLTLDHDPEAHEFPPALSMVEMDGFNKTPEILVQRFSGGAHCCAVVQILDLIGGAWRIVPGGSWDGDKIVPQDLDGDGELEIEHGDDRFLYVYSCFACASPPTRYFKLVEGALTDVSASPLFHARDEKYLPDFRNGCAEHDNGACASYVAMADRLGQHDTAWAFMLAHYDKTSDWGLNNCGGFDAAGKCLATVTYPSYPAALTAFLKRINDWMPPPPEQ